MHFSGEKAVFEVGRDKNPNFREAKREGGKRRFGGFAGFRHQNKEKTNANFVSKLAIRGVVISLTLFYLTNISKTPVLSAFPVLYYSQSKKPNGN